MIRVLSLLGVIFLASAASAKDEFALSAYPVEKVYSGKMHAPDFKGRDKGFSFYKTRILAGMKEGPTFAGEFSVIQFGCGTGCTKVVVGNNRTGELFDFPRGGEFNQALELQFDINSKMMLARWYTDSLWEACVLESFVFDGGIWIAKGALASKGDNTCDGDVSQGIARAQRPSL